MRRRQSCSSADEDEPERCPEWAEKVPPLEEHLNLFKEEEFYSEFFPRRDDDSFSKRNIKAKGGYSFNI
jgi:hypothetical protein